MHIPYIYGMLADVRQAPVGVPWVDSERERTRQLHFRPCYYQATGSDRAIVNPRQHTWTLERCGGWTKVRLSHYGTTPRRYVGTGDPNDDIAIYYRMRGYGDYQVSDLFSTERLCMLLDPWDAGNPTVMRYTHVLMRLNVSLVGPDADCLTADEICCEASIAVCSGLGGLRDRGAEVQNMIQNSFERVILAYIAETSPRNVIETAAQAIRGMSWEGLLEAAKMAGIKTPYLIFTPRLFR